MWAVDLDRRIWIDQAEPSNSGRLPYIDPLLAHQRCGDGAGHVAARVGDAEVVEPQLLIRQRHELEEQDVERLQLLSKLVELRGYKKKGWKCRKKFSARTHLDVRCVAFHQLAVIRRHEHIILDVGGAADFVLGQLVLPAKADLLGGFTLIHPTGMVNARPRSPSGPPH